MAATKAKQKKADGKGGAPGGGDLLSMGEAIAMLKTTRATFYRWLRSGKIKGLKVGRQWRFEREAVERFLKGEAPKVALPASIAPLVKELADRHAKITGREAETGTAPGVTEAVNMMIRLAEAWGASDIHITTHMRPDGEVESVVRYRIDGVLHVGAKFDRRFLPAIVERWKSMAAVDLHEKAKPQDGRILLRLKEEGGPAEGRSVDLRVNFLPAPLGECVTARLIAPDRVVLKLQQMPYAEHDMATIRNAIRSPDGIIVFTGPTGCGKTTSMYACINELAGPEIKVMAVEDPIEVYLPWVTQTNLRSSGGGSTPFEYIVRAFLRSDPDVLLVGEIRDYEVLMICQQAALTGHLVFTTLHTEDAAAALIRMVEIGSPPFVTAESTRIVVAQRLLRKLCPHCSQDGTERHLLMGAEQIARNGGLDWDSMEHNFKRPKGCAACGQTGYVGRTLISEVLKVTPEVGAALRRGEGVDKIRRLAISQGMTTIAADGIRRSAQGETDIGEVMRILGL
ncbi:MAG: Flp pilus assembly complex ATPase component TadA [Planctomycetes bacterium]|nr:Flp pilus assembly complex ATPase component TadA [Planctomycetota bacterium]